MAVNENLYSWLLKTQGMPAAEWYRSNPTKPHTSNPHVPLGAAKWFPQASTGGSGNTYASTGSDIEEVSVTEPASTGDYFQQFLNSLDPAERADIEGMGDLTAEEKADIGYNYAAQQKLGIADSSFANYQKDRFGNYKIPTSDSLVSYDPNWGEYGGYTTKEDLGFSPTSVLYKRYEDWTKNNPVPDDVMTMGAVGLRANPGYAPDYSGNSPDTLARLKAYDDAVAARSKAFEDIYKTPLSQIQYQNFSEAPSLQAFRDQFSSLGIDIPLMSDGGYFVRRATEQDPEVQQFGIYNVGRQDYRQTRINEGTQKNIELLKQQAEQGIQPSQEFLKEYVAEGGEGTQAEPQYGPRGEELGDVASILPPAMTQGDLYRAIRDRGSSSPGTKEYGELRDLQKEWIQRQQKLKGAEAPQENQSVDVRVARAAEKSDVQRERLAQQSEFDVSKEKQLASAKAADAYRRSAASEDPFRAAARVG
jgi:hypothetical protein